MQCANCSEELVESQWSDDEGWKSCPRCSTEEGSAVHVFHRYPSDYGQSVPRGSGPHPDGPQSHCLECRDRGAVGDTKLCPEVVRGALTKAAPVAPKVRHKKGP